MGQRSLSPQGKSSVLFVIVRGLSSLTAIDAATCGIRVVAQLGNGLALAAQVEHALVL